MKLSRLVMFAMAAALSAGCANTKNIKTLPVGWEDMTSKGTNSLSALPSVLKVKLAPQSFELKSQAMVLPPEVDTYVAVEFAGVELDKALYAISAYTGTNIILYRSDKGNQVKATSKQSSTSSGVDPSNPGIALGGSPNNQNRMSSVNKTSQTLEVVSSKKISLRYKGKLSALLKIIADNTGAFFVYEGDSILVTENENFSVSVPAYPKLLDEVEASISTLGGKNVSYDRLTSTLNFNSDYYSYKKIMEYCNKLKNNASLVTMRILLLNVTLNEGESSGIDWTQMVAGGGLQKPQSLGFSQAAQSATTTAASTTATTATAAATNLGNFGASALFNSSGANLVVEGANFSVSAMMSFMENYGRTSVLQNVFVESLSGTKGKIDVLTETPYVSEISVSSLSTASATASQSMKTDKAKDGVEMEISPYYSKQDGTLSLGLKVSLMGVVRMITMSAGQQIGQITQPQTTRKNVDTYLRMTPSQVVVIGGLVLEKSEDSAAGLAGDSYLTKNVVKSKSKEELVIIVKPTIIEFES